VRKTYIILFSMMLCCIGCEWHLQSKNETSSTEFAIERFDLVEARYLSTGDVAALQQMNTEYPQQTRMLIEDLLQLGSVSDAEINQRFLLYFQDSTLQEIMSEVGRQYSDLSDIDKSLASAFASLHELLPQIELPVVYTQIGSLDQSVVVGQHMLGISLDKYLGADYPLYVRYGYSEHQRHSMKRDFIVPDCISFYLLSLYPVPSDSLRHQHMGKIQCVVNRVLSRLVFQNEHVVVAEKKMAEGYYSSYLQMLESVD